MDVSELLERKGDEVFVIHPENTVPEAAGAMVAQHIGALVVLDDDGRMAGIISERDISRSVNEQCDDLPDKRVRDVMTRRVITCVSQDSIVDVIAIMQTNHVRHLPVIDKGALVGIVSMRDVGRCWLSELEKEIERLQAAAA